jgi:RNA polymerase sigma-70 factor (ECF subfamily)
MTALTDEALQLHRRELHVHCYRMLASYDEAEDAVQDTYLKAWRSRDTFEGEHLRAWLYKIATNVCMDKVRSKQRQVTALHSAAEVPWLTPYPDNELDDPDQAYVARETIELVFLIALQVLPPKQRAALLARDVLGLSATETAEVLDTSVAAANSAVQRARVTMKQHLPSHRTEWSAREPSPAEKELLATFIDSHERMDAKAVFAAATQDLRITMPPLPMCYDGLHTIQPLLDRAFGPERDGDWRLLPTMANRMPTAASYLRRPGDTVFRAFKFDVIRVEGDLIAEVTTFGPELFPVFG